MKAKAMLIALAALGITITANAQEAPTTQNKPGMYTTFSRDKASDHWFIDIQGGAAMNLSGYNRQATDLMDRISFTSPMLAIGKWHNPYFATRLQVTAWEIKGAMPRRLDDKSSTADYVMGKNTYGVAHFDFLFDLNNYFGVYRPNKVFHVIPFVGLGVGYKYKSKYADGSALKDAVLDKGDGKEKPKVVKEAEMEKDDRENVISPTINAGLMLKFRLSSVIDFNLEGQMMASRLKFTGTNQAKGLADLTAYVSGGFTFNLGKTQWDEVVPMDYQLVNDLNAQINKLRGENEELSKRPVSCPECPEVVAPTQVSSSVIVNNAVYFTINSAKIRKSQEVNIFNTAKFAKEKGLKIYLVGYADKNTGTSSYNMKLSERRAKAVADMLINKYGVSADQIVSEWKGSDEQIYSENAWNRIVLMTAE